MSVNVKHLVPSLLIGLLLSFGVHAAKIAKIDTGRVEIDNQSLAAQQKAGREALSQVFVKISGSKSALDSALIKRAVSNFEQYLVSSSYYQQNEQLIFEASFNRDKLASLLQAAGLPIWADLRPSASIWFAQALENEDRQWLTQNNAPWFNQAIQNAAFARGVSVVVPLGDLTDTMSVTEFDVWSQNSQKLLQQSSRYQSKYIISASLRFLDDEMRQAMREEQRFAEQQRELEKFFAQEQQSSQEQNTQEVAVLGAQSDPQAKLAELPSDEQKYQLDWLISDGKQVFLGRRFLENADDAYSILVDKFADTLASQFAFTNNNAANIQETRLTVSNIRSLLDYNQALSLIRDMPQVQRVELMSLAKDTASFSLSLNSNEDDFVALISLDQRIRRSEIKNSNLQNDGIRLIWIP